MTEALPTIPDSSRYAINADWLMKLRWVAVVGQLSTIGVVSFGLHISVRPGPLSVALAVTTITNIAFTLWLRRVQKHGFEDLSKAVWNRVFMTLMLLDLIVLSLLLYFTGGHSNPFILFYFVNLALAGIMLPPRRAWLLTCLSVLSFAALLYNHIPLVELQRPEHLLRIREVGHSTLGHRGLFVAFAACSAVIVYFVTRLNTELRRGDFALRRAQWLQARSDKWEALGTLSAGAAHELATPLTTIAVLSKELERDLTQLELVPSVIEEIHVIRREVDRCRAILDRMSIDAGHATAESSTMVDAATLMTATMEALPGSQNRIDLQLADAERTLCVEIPLQSVMQALRGIIQNALDASEGKVNVHVSKARDFLRIEVVDRGTGMTEEVLKRADEPFFTTKEAGKGMGLGRFLARTVFERLGGQFVTESAPGEGTRVIVTIPTSEPTR